MTVETIVAARRNSPRPLAKFPGTLVLLGAGKMGQAMLEGWLARGLNPRKVVVMQTQIMLAVVGAVIMLVVGNSLSRAFGIVGAAGLIRYRSNIADPKDAGMLDVVGFDTAAPQLMTDFARV